MGECNSEGMEMGEQYTSSTCVHERYYETLARGGEHRESSCWVRKMEHKKKRGFISRFFLFNCVKVKGKVPGLNEKAHLTPLKPS